MGLTRAALAPGACDEPFSGPSPHESDPIAIILFLYFLFLIIASKSARTRADLDASFREHLRGQTA